MTVIAYRDGVMASDGGSWAGNTSHGWAIKLAKGHDGTLYGIAGNAAEAANYIKWLMSGCEGEQPLPRVVSDDQSSFIVLLAHSTGKIELLTAHGREQYADPPYMAIGAESDVAFGALWMGATAEQAVKAACEHGDRARLPVRSIRHSE